MKLIANLFGFSVAEVYFEGLSQFNTFVANPSKI